MAPYYKKLYDAVRYRFRCRIGGAKGRAIEQHIRAMGFFPIFAVDGSIKATKLKTKFKKGVVTPLYHPSEAKEKNDFIDSVPFALLGRFKCELLMLRVVDMNMRLHAYFEKHMNRKTTTHNGVSLGYTCVS